MEWIGVNKWFVVSYLLMAFQLPVNEIQKINQNNIKSIIQNEICMNKYQITNNFLVFDVPLLRYTLSLEKLDCTK